MLVRIIAILALLVVVGGAAAVFVVDLPAKKRMIEADAAIDATAVLGGGS